MKKVLILLAICLFVALIGGVIFSRVMIGYFTPDLLVQQLESRLNCRAEVASVDAYWLGKSRLVIKGVSLAERDDAVKSGTPFAERLPLGDPPIHVGMIELKLKPGSLLLRRLYVNELNFDGLAIDMTMLADGKTSINSIFKRAPGGDPGQDMEKPNSEKKAPPLKEKKVFTAGKIPLAVFADHAGFTNSSLSLTVEKTGAVIQLKEANFEFSGIDVNPRNLAAQNRADFDFSGKIAVGKGTSGARAFEAAIRGSGETKPFDPELAQWEPSWKSEVVLAKGSRLDTVPVMENLKKKLEAVNRPGIELSGIMASGELEEDAVTEISYKRGRYAFEKDFLLNFGDTMIEVHPDSWIDSADSQHEIKAAVTASESFTKEVKTKAQAYLNELTGGRAPEAVVSTLMMAITKENRLHLEVVSSGDLSKPKPDLATPIGNLRDLMKGSGDTIKNLKELGKEFLDGFLKKKGK